MTEESQKTLNDRPPNFRDSDGALFLVRCFACGEEEGTENYEPNVASGKCAWCGWTEGEPSDGKGE